MCSVSKNIEIELSELRNKITLIKENKLISGNSRYKRKFLKCESDNVNNFYATNEVGNKKMKFETNKLVSEDEALIVENCVRKSIELIEKKKFRKLNKKANYKYEDDTIVNHVTPTVMQQKNTCRKSNCLITNLNQDINSLTLTAKKKSTDTKNKALKNNFNKVEVITFSDLNAGKKEIDQDSKSTSLKINYAKLDDQKHTNVSRSKIDFNYKKMKKIIKGNEMDCVLYPNVSKNLITKKSEIVLDDHSNFNEKVSEIVIEKNLIHFKNYKHKMNLSSITDNIKHKNNLNFHEIMTISGEKIHTNFINKTSTFKSTQFNINVDHKTIKRKHNVKYSRDSNENRNEDSEISEAVYIPERNVSSKILTINDKIKNKNFNLTERNSGISTLNTMCSVQNVLPFENKQISTFSDSSSFIKEVLSKNPQQNATEDFEQQLSHINEFLVEEIDPVESVIPVWDFKQEPVDFAIPRLHIDEKIRIMSKQEIKSLESEGIIVRTGRWSKEEEALLKRNFKDFTSQFGVTDACLLLGIGRQVSSNKHELSNVKRFLKAKHFFVRLGKDLDQRTLWNVYIKARFDFDPVRNKMKCIAKDVPIILELQKKYGNKWYLIGQKSGRPPGYCQRISSYYKKAIVKGKWSDEEIENLIYAIKSVTGVTDLSYENVKRIPWTKVAELVPFRNADQCCREWHLHLALTKTKFNYQKWDKKCVLKLIFILKNEYPVSNELDINWKEIYKSFKTVIPSCTSLKHKWYNNIKRYVPEEFKSNYSDIINFLCKKYKNEFNEFRKKDIL